MKIKIIKSTKINTKEYGVVAPWYKDDIGEIFEVLEETIMLNKYENYRVILHNKPSMLYIKCCDCEIVE